jgi:hypothetical protein
MYDGAMKQLLSLVTALAALALSAFAQSAPATVFVLPMPGGLDQFLAVHLGSSGAYRVVTDPAQATLILTDHIGENLEQILKEMAAPPPAKDALPAKDNLKDADNFTRPRMQPLTHNRGTLFLVDRASHQVLWSAFEEQKLSDPKSLNSAAKRIVERLSARRPAN